MAKQHTLRGIAETRSVFLDGIQIYPDESLKVFNHSPNGFNWGYGGSGPAQLALAVLLKLMDKEDAVKKHQQFKWGVISTLPQDKDFEIKFKI